MEKELGTDAKKGHSTSRSFIIAHGKVGSSVRQLVQDMRSVMSPYTARDLENRHNSLKDFLAVSGLLNVTHLVAFTATDLGTYMRTSRMPRGPTLTFRVHTYSLMKDIGKLHKRNVIGARDSLTPALVVMSGFASEGNHIKLMATMFQNMFPTISVANTDLKDCRRVVLIKFNKDTQRVELRHYRITLSHVNVSRTVKRVLSNRVGDHLKNYEDIADFVLHGGDALSSGSEADDPTGENQVQLAEQVGRVAASTKMAVRLIEIGPRIQFELVKVEADFFKGEVIYHTYVIKTPEEIREQHRHIEHKNALKAARRLEQERNVELKQKAKTHAGASEDDLNNLPQLGDAGDAENGSDDDAIWYKKEVGEEPDEGLFSKKDKREAKAPQPGNPHVKFVKKNKARKDKGEDYDHGHNAKGRQQKRGFKQTNGNKSNKRRKPNM